MQVGNPISPLTGWDQGVLLVQGLNHSLIIKYCVHKRSFILSKCMYGFLGALLPIKIIFKCFGHSRSMKDPEDSKLGYRTLW